MAGDNIDKSNIVYGFHLREKKDLARRMRLEMTPQEEILWERLRSNRLDGLHFRRQQIIDGFITDENVRRAIVVAAENVAGVTRVNEHLCWVDPMSGVYFPPDTDLSQKPV